MKLRLQEVLRRNCSHLLLVSRLPSPSTHFIHDGAVEPVTLLLHFWPSLKQAGAPGLHISLPFHWYHSIVLLLMLGHCALS